LEVAMSDGDKPVIRVVTAEIQRDGRYLITQRPAKAVLPLLWEFPGGRVHDHEDDATALRRACRTRIGVDVEVKDLLMEMVHQYPEYVVTLAVYRCEVGALEPWAEGVAAIAWVAPDDFENYPFPGADQRTIEKLLASDYD
jgi:8-oxo-dGTP diphosphatase